MNLFIYLYLFNIYLFESFIYCLILYSSIHSLSTYLFITIFYFFICVSSCVYPLFTEYSLIKCFALVNSKTEPFFSSFNKALISSYGSKTYSAEGPPANDVIEWY